MKSQKWEMKMKSKTFRNKIFGSIIAVVGLHVVLLFSGIFHLPLTNLLISDGILFSMFVLGTLIVSPGLDKAPDNFVNRFILLTTFQLMGMMIYILILSMTKIPYFKMIGYHTLGVFLCLLMAQAFFLVKTVKK